MADADRVITAEEFDKMTPNERAAAVRAGIVTDWNEVPPEFRERVITTAKRIAAERADRPQA
jgi:hypothetical protein